MTRCGRCKGTGKFHSLELSQTAEAVSTKRGMTVKEIFDNLPERPDAITAINNRLEILKRAGVVVVVGKKHKAKLWQRVRVKDPAVIAI